MLNVKHVYAKITLETNLIILRWKRTRYLF